MSVNGTSYDDVLSVLDRFWSRVNRDGDCWLWEGEKNNQGYGRFTFWHDGKRTRVLAHRLAAQLAGTRLDPGLVLRHQCDTPACVRPTHLLTGTQSENLRDARDRGRLNLEGLRAGWKMRPANARFDDEMVEDILGRLALGEKQSDIAARYGVSQSTISNVAMGKSYKTARDRAALRGAA